MPASAAYRPIQIGLIVLAVVGFTLASRPGISAVVWTTVVVLVLLAVVEVFVRAVPRSAPG